MHNKLKAKANTLSQIVATSTSALAQKKDLKVPQSVFGMENPAILHKIANPRMLLLS